MRPELSEIDLSAIGELARIRKEESVLEERLAKMGARSADVSPVVYERVKGDYEARRSEFARAARPLREQALGEYQRLKAVRLAVERAVQELSLQKEELEFRRDLGEFPDGTFAGQVADCEKRLADERRDLEEVLRMRNAFAAAFRTEAELEAPAPAPASPGQPAAAAIPPAPRPVAAPSPPAPPPPPPPAPLPPAPPPARVTPPESWNAAGDALTPDGTAITAPRPLPQAGRLASAQEAPRGQAMDAAPQSGTIVLHRARLSLLQGDEPVKEFILKPGISLIGRLAQSDIQLPSPDVSRRHAQVTVGPDGCFIADLGSENGVSLNGRLVENHRLEDGDVLLLGKQRLVFRS